MLKRIISLILLAVLTFSLTLFGCKSYERDTTSLITPDSTVIVERKSPNILSPVKIVQTPESITIYNNGSEATPETFGWLLSIPMYLGAGMVLLGIIIALIFKVKWTGIIVSISGAALIILSYLLAAYSLFFLIAGIIITLGFLVYLFYYLKVHEMVADAIEIDDTDNEILSKHHSSKLL